MKLVLSLLLIFGVTTPVLAQATKSERATQLNNQAIELSKLNKDAEALELINEALLLQPEEETILSNKIAILQDLKRYDEALNEADSFLRHVPQAIKIRRRKSSLLSFMGLNAEAHRENLQLYLEEAKPLPDDLLKTVRSRLGIAPETVAPRDKEIRLDGFYISGKPGSFEFEVYLFAVPSGRYSLLEPKRKTIPLQGIEPEYGDVGPIPANQLKAGDFVVVVGREEAGKFIPRRIVVAARTRSEEKKRGALFDSSALTLPQEQEHLQVDEKALGRVSFLLSDKSRLRAYGASLVRDGERTAVVTTLSSVLTGASTNTKTQGLRFGGLDEKPIRLAMIQQLETTQRIEDFEAGGSITRLGATLPLHLTEGEPFAGGEVVAVPVNNAPVSLPLAQETLKRGDIVYLQGLFRMSGTEWSKAVVAYVDDRHLFLLTDQKFLSLLGSLIVNKQGEVLGLYVRGGGSYISGVPVGALRRAIQPSNPPLPEKRGGANAPK